MTPALEIRDLTVSFPVGQALRGIDLTVESGRVLVLLGESGSGKSLLAQSCLGLAPKSAKVAGEIALTQPSGTAQLREPADFRAARGSGIGMIFQDPARTLNPVRPISKTFGDVLKQRRTPTHMTAADYLHTVDLRDDVLAAFPHELSGGMRQRVAIALTWALDPSVVFADEPTSALDVVTADKILKLLRSATDTGRTVVLITHDARLARRYSDDCVVMYAGRVVEAGPTADVLSAPAHPYTAALLESLPTVTEAALPLPTIAGQPPSVAGMPSGCAFAPRCRVARDTCARVAPPLQMFGQRQCECWISPEDKT